MNISLRGLLCVLLLFQPVYIAAASPQQGAAKNQVQSSPAIDPKSTLEDGTPVKLRISQTVSSADAHLKDRVQFEVLEDINVAGTLIISKGGIALGTVTEAQPKKWAGRGGKLEIVLDTVKLVDGERAALRATKEVKGKGHAGAMTAGIIASGVLFFPVAPLFLFIHGKDISIPKGTELSAFINGDFALDMAKFKPAVPVQTSSETESGKNSDVAVTSTPAGAEIELDGVVVGNTPSTIAVIPGDHTIILKKSGYTTWEQKIKASGGTVQISAELQVDSR